MLNIKKILMDIYIKFWKIILKMMAKYNYVSEMVVLYQIQKNEKYKKMIMIKEKQTNAINIKMEQIVKIDFL